MYTTNGLLPVMDFLPKHEFVRVSRQLPNAQVLMSGSIPLYGFRSAHLPGKPSGYRNLSSRWGPNFISIKVARNTLAVANAKRDSDLDFAQVLIRIARKLYAEDPLGVELERPTLFLDDRPLPFAFSLGACHAYPSSSGTSTSWPGSVSCPVPASGFQPSFLSS